MKHTISFSKKKHFKVIFFKKSNYSNFPPKLFYDIFKNIYVIIGKKSYLLVQKNICNSNINPLLGLIVFELCMYSRAKNKLNARRL